MTRLIVLALTVALVATVSAVLCTLPGRLTLPYSPVQPLCSPLQAGDLATVLDGPHSFTAVCQQDGAIYVWNAR